MNFDKVREYFSLIHCIDVPEIHGFDPSWFRPDRPNPDGILVNGVSWQFNSLLCRHAMPITIPAERLYYGILIQNLSSDLSQYLGPIFLAQFYSFFKLQPHGESGLLLATGWWNNARLRENPSLVASGRFLDPEHKKKGRFTQDSAPQTKGWVYDALPHEHMKSYQQGRLILFST